MIFPIFRVRNRPENIPPLEKCIMGFLRGRRGRRFPLCLFVLQNKTCKKNRTKGTWQTPQNGFFCNFLYRKCFRFISFLFACFAFSLPDTLIILNTGSKTTDQFQIVFLYLRFYFLFYVSLSFLFCSFCFVLFFAFLHAFIFIGYFNQHVCAATNYLNPRSKINYERPIRSQKNNTGLHRSADRLNYLFTLF
jgi:hypothetical protein